MTTGAQKPIGTKRPAGSEKFALAKKTAVKKKTKAVRIVPVPKKRRAKRLLWVWATAGGVALIAVIAGLMLEPCQKDGTLMLPPAKTEGDAGGVVPQPPAASTAPAKAGVPGKQLAFIEAVRLLPPQPTRTDSLKAEVTAAPGAPGKLVYAYQWKVNDGIVADAKGDTLSLSAFKKRDRITVTVTPYDGDTAGFAMASPEVAIHPIVPSLEMKITRPASKITDPIEVQLVSAAPDSEQVAFSLESPLVPGMTIDKLTGKIAWLRKPDQQGTFRFGAAVEDENRAKVTKIFEITVK